MNQRNDPSRQVERDWMVETQIVVGGVTDPAVIAAMRRVHAIVLFPNKNLTMPLEISHSLLDMNKQFPNHLSWRL